MKHNLSTKNIKDFTTADTIYLTVGSKDFPATMLCQFIKYDSKSGVVSGKVIDVDTNKEMYAQKIRDGWTVTAQLNKCALYGGSPDNPDHTYYHWFNSIDGYALHPDEEYKVHEAGVHVSKHPSFGLIHGCRFQSNGTRLFGSSLEHSSGISITISTAEHKRDYSADHYFQREELIEITLSQTQFAEFITTLNNGNGVPCTINHVNRKRMPPPPYKSKSMMSQEEFANRLHNMSVDLSKSMKEMFAALEKPNIGKGDRAFIKGRIEHFLQEIRSNIPFYVEQFKEQMDKTVQEAKTEVEAFVDNRIRTLGLEAMKDQMPQITEFSESQEK